MIYFLKVSLKPFSPFFPSKRAMERNGTVKKDFLARGPETHF